MTQLHVPQVAFLGVCDRLSKVRNVDPRFSSLNILGLRREVVGRIYPLVLDHLWPIFAVYDAASIREFEIICVSNSRGELFRWNVRFELHPADHIPADPTATEELLVSSEGSWSLVSSTFPKPNVLFSPGRLQFLLKGQEQNIPIGTLDFYYAHAPPLTEDRIAAIRSDPRAAKLANVRVGCGKCGEKILIYTGLEKSKTLQAEGYIWYTELPDRFVCKCETGRTDVDLRMLRESLHVVLGETGLSWEDISITRLYEKTTLGGIADRFRRLLERDAEEPEVQTFLEENPILFHRFSPWKIVKKPPLLNKYQADFAVLSNNEELLLIEIEKPGKRIFKKDGGRTANFTHALEQVQNWLHTFQVHRLACLDAMNLKEDPVAGVRGVVIMGRDAACDRDQLSRLKATDLGQISFFTYDDIAESLEVLIREIQRV